MDGAFPCILRDPTRTTFEKERHRYAEDIGGLLKPAGAHSVHAFFVLLYLLKREAECFA
jgi:hypothetical protein